MHNCITATFLVVIALLQCWVVMCHCCLLNLNKHISNTSTTMYMHLHRINSICPYLTEEAVKTLIQSVVISRLDYFRPNCIFVGMPLNSIRKLQLAHNTAVRVVSDFVLCNI